MLWYLPSFYGDIRLKAKDDDSCQLEVEQLTVKEKEALQKFQANAVKKGWISKTTDLTKATEPTTVRGPIHKVQASLARYLKPTRKLVSAVKFSDGTIEEVTERTFEDDGEAAEPSNGDGPYREQAAKKGAKKKKKKPKAAATVAKPRRGCPAPDFTQADVRARRVLVEFLDAQQLTDFQNHNRFISIGADTGFRYMITSRHANDALANYQRTLYDLDNERAICTHDWDVPAAEEMLALHLLLQLPGWETYLLGLDANLEPIGTGIDLEDDEPFTITQRAAIRTIAGPHVRRAVARLYGREQDEDDEVLDDETRTRVNAFVCREQDMYVGMDED